VSISEANILYSHSKVLDLANSNSSVTNFLSTKTRFSKAKYLSNHGAIFLAIIAASIAIVPDPQNKS
jgi:hypothetical protein